MDVDGQVFSYNDVGFPRHLSIVSEGRVLVADCHKDWRNDRILLLSSQLEQGNVVIDKTESHGKLRRPLRLSYNELTSRLYVAHSGIEKSRDVISLFNVD